MQSSLTSCQLKCQQLEGLNSELELSLKETTSQLSGDIESLCTQLEHTKQELTQAQVRVTVHSMATHNSTLNNHLKLLNNPPKPNFATLAQ